MEQVILKVKLLELGPPAMILQLALEPPGMSDVRRTILMLKQVCISFKFDLDNFRFRK